MYLAWYDADRKKSVAQKIAEAHERYVLKFGSKPAVCLVHPDDVVPNSIVELRPLKVIARHCFWIGVDDVEQVQDEPATDDAIAATPAEHPVKRLARTRATRPAAPKAAPPEAAPPAPAKSRTRRAPASPTPVAPAASASATKPRQRRLRSAA